MHAPDALKMIDNPTLQETEILSSFTYKENKAVLHNDTSILYPNKKIFAAWNYTTSKENKNAVTLTYWLNTLQNLKSDKEYFVTLNEPANINKKIEDITYEHPQFTSLAIKSQKRKDEICGKNNSYFAGAYWRYGFHEDGLHSANELAKKLGCEL